MLKGKKEAAANLAGPARQPTPPPAPAQQQTRQRRASPHRPPPLTRGTHPRLLPRAGLLHLHESEPDPVGFAAIQAPSPKSPPPYKPRHPRLTPCDFFS